MFKIIKKKNLHGYKLQNQEHFLTMAVDAQVTRLECGPYTWAVYGLYMGCIWAVYMVYVL